MSESRINLLGGDRGRRRIAAAMFASLLMFVVGTSCRQEQSPSDDYQGHYQLSEVKQFDPAQLSLPPQYTAVTDDRDFLRSLNSPEMVSADDRAAGYLSPDDRVVGLTLGGEPRAYPLRLVEYHELVNDMAGDVPVLVTYCPLTDSSAVYHRGIGQETRTFEITNLLHNSNLLFYDETSGQESVWVQLTGSGVYGPANNQQLERLPYIMTTWEDWSARHPNTLVMSLNTGGPPQEYQRYRYAAYFGDRNAVWYDVNGLDKSYGLREPAIVVYAGSEVQAYPYSELAAVGEPLEQSLAGKRFTIELNPQTETANIVQADEGVVATHAFWWAWRSFYPQASSFKAGN